MAVEKMSCLHRGKKNYKYTQYQNEIHESRLCHIAVAISVS